MEPFQWSPAIDAPELLQDPSLRTMSDALAPGGYQDAAAYALQLSACGAGGPLDSEHLGSFLGSQCFWDGAWGGLGPSWELPVARKASAREAFAETSRGGRQQGGGSRKKLESHGNVMKNDEVTRQAPPWTDVTTVMMRNLPNKYTQQKLLEELQSNGFESVRDFDFFYLPMDHCTAVNLGYCFINFVETGIANSFAMTFQGKRMQRFNSSKTIQVMPASIQGFERNFGYYASRRVAQDGDPQYRPLFFRPDLFLDAGHMSAVGLQLQDTGDSMGRHWDYGQVGHPLGMGFPSGYFDHLVPGAVPDSHGESGATLSTTPDKSSRGLSAAALPHITVRSSFLDPACSSSEQLGDPASRSHLAEAGHDDSVGPDPEAAAPFAFHAAMLGINLVRAEAAEHEGGFEASSAQAGASDVVRRFVKARSSIRSAGSGYLGAEEGEELLALHVEGDWYYGFVLMDPSQQGWFPRSQVSEDDEGVLSNASLPHLLVWSRGAPSLEASDERPTKSLPVGPPRGEGGSSDSRTEDAEPPAEPKAPADGRQEPVDRPAAVRCFLRASVSFDSAGSGYIRAEKGEELVALHSEGAWYYGLVLLDPLRQGWFSKDLVTL